MLFNSFGFLAFFAAVVVAYYAVPHTYRWPLVAGASLYFYGALDTTYVPLLLGVTLVAYGAALAVERSAGRGTKRAVLAAALAATLAPLLVFKSYGFGGRPLTAAGLSFYTLSCASYLVDVYAGRLTAERHAGRFVTYVSFFPKLLAGPLERAKPFLERLVRPVAFDAAAVTAGLQLMLWGLFKKVVIADRLALAVDAAYRQPSFAAPADLLLATYLFAFQIYCDFSGYSDIAIGAARVLGFDLMENFRRPYFATSVREFWSSRWHISLMAWFRDYLYIPLGGNRVSRVRLYANVMAVFLVSGLWHGANWTFVAWGALNGVCYVASLALGSGRRGATRPPARAGWLLLQRLGTFHLVLVTWVFFRAPSIADATTVISRVAASLSGLAGPLYTRLTMGDMPVTLVFIAILLIVEALDEARPFWTRVSALPVFVRWPVYYALVFAMIVLGRWNLQQFVYMQF